MVHLGVVHPARSGIRRHHLIVVLEEEWAMGSAGGAFSWTFLPPDDKNVVAPYAGKARR